MATNTKNLGLIKPEQEDFYNVDDFNQNFQNIDNFAGGYGYYTGNVDELKQPGTYVVVIGYLTTNGTFPIEGDYWFTVNVFTGGTGSITQIWCMSTPETSNIRFFIRHSNGEVWSEYYDSNNYLPLTGGTLSGGLKISNGHGSLGAIEQYLSLAHKADPNSNNYRNLSVSTLDELKNSLILHEVVNGTEIKAYKIYGEHNFFVEDEEHPYCFYRTVYGEREWLNPPMEDRVAYKTSERYNGASVFVYSQEVYFDGDYEGAVTNIPVNMNETKHFIDISGIYQGKVIGSLNDGTYKVTSEFIEDNQFPNGGYYALNIKTSSNLTSDVHPAKIRFICKYITEQG